jgi:hypothetical protein
MTMRSTTIGVFISFALVTIVLAQRKDGFIKTQEVFHKVRWEMNQSEVRKVFRGKEFTTSGTFEKLRTIGYFDTLDQAQSLISFHFTNEDKLVRLDIAFVPKGGISLRKLSENWKKSLTSAYGIPATLAEGIYLWVADQKSILVLGITPNKELGIQYWLKPFFFQSQQMRLQRQK